MQQKAETDQPLPEVRLEDEGIGRSRLQQFDVQEDDGQQQHGGHQSPQQHQGRWTCYLFFSVFSSVLGTSFMYGYQSGVVNAPYDVMSRFVNESNVLTMGRSLTQSELNTQWSLVVSLFLVGGVIGSCWFPDFLANKIGRKRSLLYTSVIGAVGGLLCFIAPYTGSFIPLMVGRVVLGFHSGIAMVIIPALLVELPPVKLRGACGSFSELTIVAGNVISNLVALRYILGTEELWHILFILTTVVYVTHAVLLFFSAESPRWLIDKKRDDEAIEILKKLRQLDEDQVRPEFDEIKEISVAESAIKQVSFVDVFRNRQLWWPLIISINLHFSQQLTGIGAVVYYASQVMTEAGLDEDIAKVANFAISIINVIATIICLSIVDRVGRRVMLLIGLAGMGFSHVFLTIVLVINQFYASIAGFAFFLCAFSLGPGPVPWFVTAEMFTQGSRPLALSVCLFVNWVTNLAVGLLFPLMQEQLKAYAFLPFGIWSFLEFVFMFLFLPETSGITVEEVVAKFMPGQPIFQFRLRQRSAHLTER